MIWCPASLLNFEVLCTIDSFSVLYSKWGKSWSPVASWIVLNTHKSTKLFNYYWFWISKSISNMLNINIASIDIKFYCQVLKKYLIPDDQARSARPGLFPATVHRWFLVHSVGVDSRITCVLFMIQKICYICCSFILYIYFLIDFDYLWL